MSYEIELHGDSLEKKYAEFIKSEFIGYSKVWSTYIGNTGSDKKAAIKGYPSERDQRRQKFSEYTYTTLQSIVSLKHLIEKQSYRDIDFSNIEQLLALNDSFILFFAYLGRIKDNVHEATSCLLNCHTSETSRLLEDFYKKRNVVLHGQMLPLIFLPTGEILIPSIGTDNSDQSLWHDTKNSWEDLASLKKEKLQDACESIFFELLNRLNHIFEVFHNRIKAELKLGNYVLEFKYMLPTQLFGPSDNSTPPDAFKVYGNINPDKY